MAPLAPGDVLVRIRASGLCHTDLEVIQGSLAYPLPIVLGHEGAGIVEAVGDAVTLVQAGRPRRLLVEPALRPLLLLRARPADPVRAVHAPPAARPSARRRLAAALRRRAGCTTSPSSSSHAEYCVVPESGAIEVPKEIPFDRACLHRLRRHDRRRRGQCGWPASRPGASVAVIGCGAVGLNAVQGARARAGGARSSPIDRDPARLAMATRFGATARARRAGERRSTP